MTVASPLPPAPCPFFAPASSALERFEPFDFVMDVFFVVALSLVALLAGLGADFFAEVDALARGAFLEVGAFFAGAFLATTFFEVLVLGALAFGPDDGAALVRVFALDLVLFFAKEIRAPGG